MTPGSKGGNPIYSVKSMTSIYTVNGNGKAIFTGAFIEQTRGYLYQSALSKLFYNFLKNHVRIRPFAALNIVREGFMRWENLPCALEVK